MNLQEFFKENPKVALAFSGRRGFFLFALCSDEIRRGCEGILCKGAVPAAV